MDRDDIFKKGQELIEQWETKSYDNLKIELKKLDLQKEMKDRYNVVFSEVSQETNSLGKVVFSNSDAREAETQRRLIEDDEDYAAYNAALVTMTDQTKHNLIDIEATRMKYGLHKAYLNNSGN